MILDLRQPAVTTLRLGGRRAMLDGQLPPPDRARRSPQAAQPQPGTTAHHPQQQPHGPADHATRLDPSLPASFASRKAESENPLRVNPQRFRSAENCSKRALAARCSRARGEGSGSGSSARCDHRRAGLGCGAASACRAAPRFSARKTAWSAGSPLPQSFRHRGRRLLRLDVRTDILRRHQPDGLTLPRQSTAHVMRPRSMPPLPQRRPAGRPHS